MEKRVSKKEISRIQKCYYADCYDNHNLLHECLRRSVTIDFTGNCENINHCDEFECNDCERFSLCKKQKKREFLLTHANPKKTQKEVELCQTVIQYCDYNQCDWNRNSRCSQKKGVKLDENATCMNASFTLKKKNRNPDLGLHRK